MKPKIAINILVAHGWDDACWCDICFAATGSIKELPTQAQMIAWQAIEDGQKYRLDAQKDSRLRMRD